MYSEFTVSESECLLCTNQLLKELGKLQGVFGAEVDRISGRIVVSHTDEVSRAQILEILGVKEAQALAQDEPSIWGCAL